jgi:hypothetical protein
VLTRLYSCAILILSRGENKVQNFLMNCFYDGLTVEQASKTYEQWYGKKLSAKSINVARDTIKRTTNKDWN